MSRPPNHPLSLHPAHLPWPGKDDWQGIGNAHERRKIQNRINQRARRSRLRNEAKVSTDGPNAATIAPMCAYAASRRAQTALARQVDFETILQAINIFDPESWETHSLVRAFETLIYNNWLVRAPRPALLPSLIRFNFARAIMANARVLGITSNHLDDEAVSYFTVEGPWPKNMDLRVGTLPAGLQPTDLQRRTPHHPWVDLLPIPQMRDNLLRRGLDSIDEDGLCHDMIGLGDREDAAFVVWSDSWDFCGWEVTECFAKSSWSWTLEGCRELHQSTNKWRAQRGEPPLFSDTH